MAGLPYNLGGFSGQLSLEELQRAQALAAGAPPPDMSVQRGVGAPAQRIRQYNAADLADQNAMIGLAGRAGQQESASALERSGMRTEQAEAQRGYNEQARADAAEDRARGEKKRDQADKLLEEYRANMTPPSPTSGERAMQVIAAALAGGSGKGRAISGLLSGLASSGREQRWAAEQEGRTQLYQMVTRGINLDSASEEQRHEVARRMGAADALYWDNAIEAAKERGLSQAALTKAEALQLELRQKARANLRDEAVREQKAGAAGQKTRLEEYFYRVPLEELRAMPSQVRGKVGETVLAARTKNDQAYRGGEAEISIKEGKAEGEKGPGAGQLVPGGRRVRDPGVYGLLEKPTLAKYVDGETKAQSALRNINELQTLVSQHGTESLPGQAKRRMQFLEKQIKLDLKDAGELGTWDKGSAEVLGEMIGDPTAWNLGLGEVVEGVGTRLEEAKHMIRYKTEQRAKSLGLEYDRGAVGEVPATSSDPRVRPGFAAPDAADRGVRPAVPQARGVSPSFQLPQSGGVSLDEIRRAQQRVQALDQGVPLAWVR